MEEDASIGASLLFDSIRRGKLRMLRFILDSVDRKLVNTRDIRGRTPLIMTCYIKEEMIRGQAFIMMLQSDADCGATDDAGRDVLSYACEHRCNDLVQILVRVNIDPEIADVKGNTPLIYSAMVGNDVALDLLVRHFSRLGLHVDHMNKEGFTALLMAAKMGNMQCAEILVLQGKASLLHRDRVRGLSAEEWFETQGLSLKETLRSACRAAERQRFRRVLSVIQANKPQSKLLKKYDETKTRVAESQVTSSLLRKRNSLQANSDLTWRDAEFSTGASLATDTPRDKTHRHRSSSLCLTMGNTVTRPFQTLQRLYMSQQPESEIDDWPNTATDHLVVPPARLRSRSEERPPLTRPVVESSESDSSENDTAIQSLSATSMEKLEEEIAQLF